MAEYLLLSIAAAVIALLGTFFTYYLYKQWK